MKSPLIDIAGVVVAGRQRPLIDGLSLSVNAGEVHAIVGPPGAGKSVTVALLMGLRRPFRGLSQIHEFDCYYQSEAVRQHATFVPDSGHFDPTLTPRAHVTWATRLAGGISDPVSIRRALRQSEVPDRYFDTPYGSVPGGYTVLTWLAIAHLRRHGILILDEPTGSLTSNATARTARMLQQFATEGAAILVTTRDPRFAEAAGNAITVLEQGKTDRRLVSTPQKRWDA